MPLPLSINLTIVRHLARERLRRPGQRLPLVLMLELTHACNLKCAGCGRIVEYASSRADALDREQALGAIAAAGTPVVSVSGGEPLLHPETPAIVADALAQGKVVYLCTNGLLLEKRLREFSPHKHFYFNVHLDGPPEFHDALTGLPGTADRALAAIVAAKAAGFGVTTNTTVYRDTDIASVAGLFGRLTNVGVDGLMVAPAFAYEVGTQAATLARPEAEARFRTLQAAWGARNLYHTPLYMSFLRGERSLQCLPWGTVTYSPQGWRRPCYLLADGHADTFASLMDDTEWGNYGPGRDRRCANCMLHSGFEPSVMSSMKGPRDWWQMARWQLAGADVEAQSTALSLAIDRACSYYLRRQDPAGYWVGELESNATITAEYVFFRRLLGLGGSEDEQRAARQLLAAQVDGGWPLYYGGPPDLNATIEAAVALQLAGIPADDPARLAAAAVARSLGGLAHVRVFTRIWLSFLGAVPARAVPFMPAAMILQPRASLLSIDRFSSWARGTIVPLLVLLNRPLPYRGPVPDVSALWTDERVFAPRQHGCTDGRGPLRAAAAATFRQIDRHRGPVARALSWPWLEEACIDACRRWLLAHQESDGGWGGIQPAMVHSALALSACGKDPEAVERAVGAIEGFCIREDGRLRMQSCVSPGWDTPWAMLALRAAGLPANHPAIAAAARWLAGQQSTTYGDWSRSAPGVPAGGWPFEFANASYPDTDDTAIVVQALAASTASGRAARAAGVLWLLGMQNEDGGWAAFDRGNDTGIVQCIPFCDFGEVVDPSSADVTAHVLELAGKLGFPANEPHVRRGLAYLLGEQERDGSWYGRWGVNYVYGTSTALQALAALRFAPEDAPVAAAVAWLRRRQNEDGGWGESCRSYEDPAWHGRGNSTASQTAWGILGLLPFAEPDDAAIGRAAHWLLARQRSDGAWDEPEFTGTGFPGDFYIKYHEYRNYFPLLALALVRQRAGGTRRHDPLDCAAVV